MDRTTQGNLATAETLLSSSIIGIIYAIFAGQPLVIMGITGPVAILLGTSYTLTEKFDADYFAFFFWICIWAGLMHMVSACIGLVSLVWKVTPFTSQIFELFIAVTFLYASVRDLIEPIYLGQDDGRPDKSAQYASLVLGLLTFYIAWTLHFCEQWAYFDRTTRTFLTSYNTMIAVVVVTAISFLPGMDLESNGVGGLDRVNVSFPWDWQPTADRDWITSPFTGIDAKGIFGAIIPGFMFFLLFIIDHNVSSILTQDAKFNLQKPPAYHWVRNELLVLYCIFIIFHSLTFICHLLLGFFCTRFDLYSVCDSWIASGQWPHSSSATPLSGTLHERISPRRAWGHARSGDACRRTALVRIGTSAAHVGGLVGVSRLVVDSTGCIVWIILVLGYGRTARQ